MKNIAVLLTVFNRCDITLAGLRSLYKAISYLSNDYHFDIYMTDDGCKDGTKAAVSTVFPSVTIVEGDGNLYWSGGMRAAWSEAVKHNDYDYYLWFNDDAMLFEDALVSIFKASESLSQPCIVTGAFCDNQGVVSYGGKSRNWKLIAPIKNKYQPVHWMNGNLVLISKNVYKTIGMIDTVFIHGTGDYDYGRRAAKAGFDVVLTDVFVGQTNRHDDPNYVPYKQNMNIIQRFRVLYSPRFSPIPSFIFSYRHIGLFDAIRVFLQSNLNAVFPFLKKYIYKIGKYKRSIKERR